MGSTLVKNIPKPPMQSSYGLPMNYGSSKYGPARPYGSAQRYTSPSSSYRAPATYSQPSQPQVSYTTSSGGKRGVSPPPHRSAFQQVTPEQSAQQKKSLNTFLANPEGYRKTMMKASSQARPLKF